MRNRELPQHVHAGAHYILVTLGALGKGAVTVMFLLLDWKSGSLKVQGVLLVAALSAGGTCPSVSCESGICAARLQVHTPISGDCLLQAAH